MLFLIFFLLNVSYLGLEADTDILKMKSLPVSHKDENTQLTF